MMNKHNWNVLLGAAFLMATSAIGPGFLTQTAVFTAQLGASFAFVILLSILIDAVAQLNIWRIVTVSNQPAQQVANRVLPGLGYAIAALVFLGGMAFNIGNIAGAGLGLNVLLGLDVAHGAIISAGIAIAIFIYKEAGKAMDWFAKVLGVLMIALTLYIAYQSKPPVGEALIQTIAPKTFSFTALLTIVGGTVGGYITFAGAHRLLDAGVAGQRHLPAVNRGALSAIGIASLMRILLFLAALGVVSAGHVLDAANPPASVFKLASGEIGYKLFGLVMWSAAITSVVGAAYTSVSFIRSFHARIAQWNNSIIVGFILTCCMIYLIVGQPVKTLIVAGAFNGLILPLSLAIMLIAAYHPGIVGTYRQPLWLSIAGVAVVVLMTWMGYETIVQLLA
ncbi:NRAMP family divalent metal transporter [Parapedobacter koreensis]|uniref:Mn2+ and Fe2+ transporters of the NRAMP family n=1 Tax=Parapedobacter koreensis TaxID=332977 RepID=A0A1H7MTA1_9SPHI|nr:NRAMP family divalent metal transporter [Parapedobacter koreensis]SEL14321.1 Mn2+ and Fe2+ transporters of the NRAMP family [Parapedobacter koreensis]